MPTALIADDEDLPRAELRRMLAEAWPELQVVADCEDGHSAIEALHTHAPDVAFLDIRMPGASGLQVPSPMLSTLTGRALAALPSRARVSLPTPPKAPGLSEDALIPEPCRFKGPDDSTLIE